MPTQTYWLERTDEVAWGLRRYSRSGLGAGFDCAAGFHSALVYLGRKPVTLEENEHGRETIGVADHGVPHDDPRWPTECQRGCGYRFTEDDEWQDWQELIYRRTDTGADHVLHTNASADVVGAPSAPAGATWDAWWMPSSWRRADGIYLMVRLPNDHDWAVDSEASNCTRKGEPHECWVRHGDPRECRVTVGKNGDTCAAGAGSIMAGDYHGFLQGGVLTDG